MPRRLILVFVLIGFAAVSCDRGPQPGARGSTPTTTQIQALPDSDADGIPDAWERDGVEYTWPVDGSKRRLDMKQLGASPSHKDVFVWVAWMDADHHTHRPNPTSIDMVTEAFDFAHVTNPDGVAGINLHVVMAPSPMPEQAMLPGVIDEDWSAFDKIKAKYFPPEFGDAVFFALFAHDFAPQHYSGIARTIPGRDFIVSLGGFTNQVGGQYAQAGTFMHELGHVLGLHHGGSDDLGYKPNYVSVMNYFFQLNGLTINGEQGYFNYSEFELAAKESKLSENAGLTSDPALAKYGSFYWCAGNRDEIQQLTAVGQKKVDWNCDKIVGNDVSTDVNGDASVTDLAGASDWSRVTLRLPPPPPPTLGAAAPQPRTRPREMTPTQGDQIPLFPVTDVHAEPTGGSVVVKWRRVPLDRVFKYNLYRTQGSRETMVASVENTRVPSFVDLPPKGEVSYSVSAVFAPLSYEAQVADSPAPPGPVVPASDRPERPQLWKGAPKFAAPFFHVISDPGKVTEIIHTAPKQAGAFGAAGITAVAAPASLSLKALFETVRSAPAKVVVK